MTRSAYIITIFYSTTGWYKWRNQHVILWRPDSGNSGRLVMWGTSSAYNKWTYFKNVQSVCYQWPHDLTHCRCGIFSNWIHSSSLQWPWSPVVAVGLCWSVPYCRLSAVLEQRCPQFGIIFTSKITKILSAKNCTTHKPSERNILIISSCVQNKYFHHTM